VLNPALETVESGRLRGGVAPDADDGGDLQRFLGMLAAVLLDILGGQRLARQRRQRWNPSSFEARRAAEVK
jgi:hypothetical protein